MGFKLSDFLYEIARVPSQVSSEVAQKVHKEIQKKFDQGRDPYGRKWAKLAPATIAKGRHHPPLTDTGIGRSRVRVKPTQGAGIDVESSVSYMDHHMTGTAIMPRRPFLPDDGLPDSWRKIWQGALDRRYAKAARRKKVKL